MLFGFAVLVFLACWVALLHWHGTVSEEQVAEARRLEEWTRRLVKYEASRPVPYDQDKQVVAERCPHCQSPARVLNGVPYRCQWCQKSTVLAVNPQYLPRQSLRRDWFK